MKSEILNIVQPKFNDNIALENDKDKLTYRELYECIESNVSLLKNLGIKKCDHVAICIRNSMEYIKTFLSLWKLDATIIPIDSQVSISNFIRIVKSADVQYVITDNKKYLGYLEKNEVEINKLRKLILLKGKEYELINFNIKDFTPTWIQEKGIDKVSPHGFLMLFTSGTISTPKGVILKKESFISNVNKVIEYTNLSQEDSIFINLPLTYSFALSESICHLRVGGKIVLTKNNIYNSLIINELREKKITNYAATSYFYETVVKELDEKGEDIDLPDLRFFMSAGSYLSSYVITKMIQKFPHIKFFNNYGQTEASPRLAYNCLDINSEDLEGVGRPLPGVKFNIFNADGSEAKDGEIGEIGYKSEDIMVGYYGKEPLDPERYFMSGDSGVIVNGNLKIVGKTNSIIKINGRKVCKSNIEDELYKLDIIKNIKLKKESHERYGEYFVAYVVLREGVEDKDKAIEYIENYCKNKFNAYERPKKIVSCKGITLSSNKKVKFNVDSDEVKK